MNVAAINAYVAGQDSVSAAARAMLARLCETLSSLPADQQRDMLLQLLPTIADTYGDAAAELAARWYEEQRGIALGVDTYQAIAAPTDSAARVTSTIRDKAGLLYGADGNIDALMQHLVPLLDMIVRDASRHTIADNLDADPSHPGWARYAEAKACAFCIMVSSQGAVYESKSAAGGDYHQGCRCVPVPLWRDDVPDAVRERIEQCQEMWDEAQMSLPQSNRGSAATLAQLRHQTGGH